VLTGGLLTLALCGMVRCRLSLAQLGWSVASLAPSAYRMHWHATYRMARAKCI
jgi:hypothetical protein